MSIRRGTVDNEGVNRTSHPMGVITDSLRATMRDLAASDARLYRGLAAELGAPTAKPALPANDIAAAIALLRAHGYKVTPPRG
jgi:hypothetical protein